MASKKSLVWLDDSSQQSQNYKLTSDRFHLIDSHFTRLQNEDEWNQFLKSSNKEISLIVITNDELGKRLISKLQSSTQVKKIYILYSKEQVDDKWIKDYDKIRGVYNDLSSLEKILRTDFDIDSTIVDIPYKATRKSVLSDPVPEVEQELDEEQQQPSTKCFSELYDVNTSYMISDSCFEMIPHIRISTSAKDSFIDFYRNITENNSETAGFIKSFEDNYTADQAIKWLCECPFIWKFLEMIYFHGSIESMIHCQLFINDIPNQLKTLMCDSTIEVYRYELISNEQFEYLKNSKDQIIAMKYFFLANTDRTTASLSIENQCSNNEKRVVFTVEANPRLTGIKPFAKIGSLSQTNDQNYVLFMIGSLFKLTDIIEETNELINIKLTLCAGDTNQQMCNEIKMKYANLSDGIDLIDFAQFLSELSKGLAENALLKQSEQIIRTCMNKLADDDFERYRCYRCLEIIALERQDLDMRLECYQKLLDLIKQKQPNNSIYLTEIYLNLGQIYLVKEQLQEALNSFHELAQLYKHQSGDDCADLMCCYVNIAIVYEKQENYQDELSYYYRALSIMNKHYQSIDQTYCAILYSNIGVAYTNLNEYHLALGFFRTALDKRLKLHSNVSLQVAKLYVNIAFVYEKLNDIQKTKHNYNEAAKIYEQLNGPEDPNVKTIAETLQNLMIHN